jgi:hypothetical protein
METEQDLGGNVPPKKKGKRTLIIVLIVLAVLAIPTCGVVGILVAVAIPALSVAKQDARNVIASQVFEGLDEAKQNFTKREGRSPKTWDDIAPYLEFRGETLSSPQDLVRMTLGEGKLEISGLDGATQTKIILEDGAVITPESAKGRSNLYTEGMEASNPSGTPDRPKSLQPPVSSGTSGTSGSLGASESTRIPNLDNLDPQQMMTALMEAGESLEKIHAIMAVSQKQHGMVDWRALAALPNQSQETIDQLYLVFTKMGRNSLSAMPFLEQVQQTSLPPEISKLYQNVIESNVATCSAGQKLIKTYRETGEFDKRYYSLIVKYDKRYAQALQDFMEFNESMGQ